MPDPQYLDQLMHRTGAKKPQLPEQQADVVAGAAEHGVDRVAIAPLSPFRFSRPSVFM